MTFNPQRMGHEAQQPLVQSALAVPASGAAGDRLLHHSSRARKEDTGTTVSVEVISDQEMNAAVQIHASTSDWDHAALARDLTTWQVRFNHSFFGGRLPIPVIAIGRADRRMMGSYTPGRDHTALRHRIMINSLYLNHGKVELLDTLLHEMLHLWEEAVVGRCKPTYYHTKEFRRKADELGIPTTERGCSVGVRLDGPFARLLREHGVDVMAALGPQTRSEASGAFASDGPFASRPASRARLRRWECECMSVYASKNVVVQGRCDACGARYERVARSAD